MRIVRKLLGGALVACGLAAPIWTAAGTAKANSENTVYSFSGGEDGAYPQSTLVIDKSGNLYGTTPSGGTAGDGVIFKLTPDGHETVLHSFAGGADGLRPMGGLVAGPDGNFYGATYQGGAGDYGTIFRVTPRGKEKVLYALRGGKHGEEPQGRLVADPEGNLYGTAFGGIKNAGIVFKVTSRGRFTVLHAFGRGADGAEPAPDLACDSNGNVYGTTLQYGDGYGTVFRISPSGAETVLYSFKGGSDGFLALGALALDSKGKLYGTTSSGGGSGNGTIFKLSQTGRKITLYSFNADAVGDRPSNGLILDTKGNFYGTTTDGGEGGLGTVFKLTPKGELSVLYAFFGGDGTPSDEVSMDGAGNLYGTTANGGSANAGTVFEVTN
jgi:uncharacterized repeat protein (TIGR03803 family)